MKKIISTALATAAIVAIVPASASASTSSQTKLTVTGAGTCQTDGSFQITWTLTNLRTLSTMAVTASSDENVVPLNTQLKPNVPLKFTQTVDGSQVANYNLSIADMATGASSNFGDTGKGSVTNTLCAQPGGKGGETPVVESAAVAPVAPAVVPVGAVSAGNGGASKTVNVAAIAALVASAMAVGFGVIRRVQKR